jgi:hypothetical protein
LSAGGPSSIGPFSMVPNTRSPSRMCRSSWLDKECQGVRLVLCTLAHNPRSQAATNAYIMHDSQPAVKQCSYEDRRFVEVTRHADYSDMSCNGHESAMFRCKSISY